MDDRNFNELADRFIRNIYNEKRGQLRLAIVRDDLYQHLPQLTAGAGLQVLDAGCGFSPLADELLQHGHRLTLCDVSENLLGEAKQRLQSHPRLDQVEFVHQSVQLLLQERNDQYDLVLFHAVMEWLAEPMRVLGQVIDRMRSGSYLSLLFYNRNALVYRNLIKGNLRKIKSGRLHGDPGSLTPNQPLDPQTVYDFLQRQGVETICHSGVRTFFDMMDKKQRERISFEDLYEQERIFSQQMPFRDLGRYIHMIIKR